MFVYVCLSVCLSDCLFVCFVCSSVCWLVCLFVRLSACFVCIDLSVVLEEGVNGMWAHSGGEYDCHGGGGDEI